MSAGEHEPTDAPDWVSARGPLLSGHIEPHAHGDALTVWPPDAQDEQRITHWITAIGDAWIDLEAIR